MAQPSTADACVAASPLPGNIGHTAEHVRVHRRLPTPAATGMQISSTLLPPKPSYVASRTFRMPGRRRASSLCVWPVQRVLRWPLWPPSKQQPLAPTWGGRRKYGLSWQSEFPIGSQEKPLPHMVLLSYHAIVEFYNW